MTAIARVCHISTVHNPRDNRVFRKECGGLARSGADIWFIGAQSGDEVADGVHVIGVGRARNRVDRLTRRQIRAWRALERVNPDVVHVHDPELIPLVMVWKTLRGRAAVFDAHEDLVGQIDAKEYLSPLIKPIARLVAKCVVGIANRGFDGIVAATPTVLQCFSHRNSAVVRNFPLASDYVHLEDLPSPDNKKDGQAVYVGMLSAGRQVDRMFEMIEDAPAAHLVIAGMPDPEVKALFEDVDSRPRVRWLRRIPAEEVPRLLEESWVGVMFMKHLKNHDDAMPTKVFEYMAAGIPFVASKLPYMEKLLKDRDCGVFVDTEQDADAAAGALEALLADPERCIRMGANGRRTILEGFNFESELSGVIAVETAALRRQDAVVVPDSGSAPSSTTSSVSQ